MEINDEILQGFINCQYKGYLKSKRQTGIISEYQIFYNQLKQKRKTAYENSIAENNKLLFFNSTYNGKLPKEGISLNLRFSNINIDLMPDGVEFKSRKKIVPILIIPSEKVSISDKLFIVVQAFIIKREFNLEANSCKIIYGKNIQSHEFKIVPFTKQIKTVLNNINNVLSASKEPPHILNSHCAVCEYCEYCKEKAKEDDNISLLDRATSKIIAKYNKKGIFTIQQLSYLYKPRKGKKHRIKKIAIHNIELQALAIRTNKIYLQQLPELSRQSIELFLDIEGNPEKELFYLFGILIIQDSITFHKSFWADNTAAEADVWQRFISIAMEHSACPIYHYGNYEAKAIEILGKRYNTDITQIQNRLVNINHSIYGKVYFPVYSNRLKELGKYFGAIWSTNNASGVQALVWRDKWEETQNEKYKQLLIVYNKEDCESLKLLTDKLSEIQASANILSNIDFAVNPKKNLTLESTQVNKQFDSILKFAHENYDIRKISLQNIGQNEISETKLGAKIGHKGTTRVIPKAKKIIIVPDRKICPIDNSEMWVTAKKIEKVLTDFVFRKTAIRKTIIKYIGNKSYCFECSKFFIPSEIEKISGKYLGHRYKAWVIYQRLMLRLPFDIIQQNLKELFNEKISVGGLINIFKSLSSYYEYTEQQHLKEILSSPFIHVDETKVNVKGVDHFVWIFTNGKQVIFRETETREINMVQGLLKDFKGILIADFYPGYDSLKCKHQKCWVHLIRDLNEDLRKNPFDIEYGKFILQFRNLIVPIFESISKFGLKKIHFNKFRNGISAFYNKEIINKTYNSEITIKYQKRLEKHWDNLFAFTEYDSIPWNNNTAERGLRHLAVQRKISTFFDTGLKHYLLFLGIKQTCRFLKKSFLKFLLSERKVIEE